MQKEFKHLKIDTKEEQLPPEEGGQRLRARTVKTGTVPPLPPPQSSSVPPNKDKTITPPTIKQNRLYQRHPTPLPYSHIEWNAGSSGGIDTTDADTGGSCLSHTAFKLDSCLARIFFPKFGFLFPV